MTQRMEMPQTRQYACWLNSWWLFKLISSVERWRRGRRRWRRTFIIPGEIFSVHFSPLLFTAELTSPALESEKNEERSRLNTLLQINVYTAFSASTIQQYRGWAGIIKYMETCKWTRWASSSAKSSASMALFLCCLLPSLKHSCHSGAEKITETRIPQWPLNSDDKAAW